MYVSIGVAWVFDWYQNRCLNDLKRRIGYYFALFHPTR